MGPVGGKGKVERTLDVVVAVYRLQPAGLSVEVERDDGALGTGGAGTHEYAMLVSHS